MNPLMDALKLAGDPGRASATPEVDFSSDHRFIGDRPLEPVRAAGGDTGPAAAAPAVPDAGESSGPGVSDAWRLGPIRATRDDMDEPVPGPFRSHAAPATDPPHSGAAPDPEIPAGPIRAMDHASDVPEGHVHPSSHERSDAGESAPAAFGAFDPRNLRRGPGVARIAGIALSLLAVVAAAAGGGYFIWKTEFVRPALVGGLPPDAVPVVDLTPVHAANAATNEAGEPAASAALRIDTPARPPTSQASATAQQAVSTALPDAGTPQGTERNATGGPRASAGAIGARAVSSAETFISERPVASAPMQAAEIPGPGRPEQMAVPDSRAAARTSPTSSSGHAGWTTTGHRDRFSATDTPGSATPAVEARAPVRAGASVGAADIPAPEPDQGGAEHRRDAGTGIVIRKRTRPDHVAVSLERAYRAFLSGDGGSAAQAYRVVLGHEPGNRDAHLGLAALAARAGRWNEAAGHYARVLESHPADTAARAALVAIDERDPAQRESRLKALLASEPNAAHLHFDLGNLYTAQRRWPEARRSFSDAYRFDRSNADYAYNLAVSLDHLSRPEGALGLYREALLLSRNRISGFDTVAVRQRIRALELHARTGPESVRPAADAAVAAPAVRIR